MEKNILKGSIVLLLISFFCFFNFAFAATDSLCTTDADVVLLLDVSGSMNDFTPSKCQWWQLDLVDTTYQYVAYNQNELTELECLAKPLPNNNQNYAPLYTPLIPVKIDSAKDAAKTFTDKLMSQDQSALVTFSDAAQLVKQLSIDHAATKSFIDSAITGGATDIGDAIGMAIAELDSTRGNSQATKTIILLTDGKANKPNGSGINEFPADVTYAEQKASEAAAKGYKIFTIGLGADGEINTTMLQNIANITGATYHHSPDGTFLSDIYQAISSEMCQYGSISGCKYSDLNNNGTIDVEEPKLSGWEISLSGAATSTQATDEAGCYQFAGLLPGNYKVSEAENAGKKPFTQTFPLSVYDINLSSGSNMTDYNFANYLGEQPSGIQPGDIVINEIMQNPLAVSDTVGEWFELYNTTNSSVDLTGCTLGDNSSINTHTIISLVIPANSYSVLARNGDFAVNGGVSENYVYNAFGFNNTSDQIILTCNSVEIDRVEYDGGPNFPNPNGASMVLGNLSADNNVGSNWCVSKTAFGAGDKGTPGTANDSCGSPTLYTITATAGANGSISPSGGVSVASGSNQTFTITPASGYQVENVLADGVSVGAVVTHTFNNVTANHTISASFSAVFILQYDPPIATPPAGTYSSGQSVVLTAPGSTSIYYTTNGTSPTCSTGTVYTDAISVASTLTINAVACYGENSSSVAVFPYVINTGNGGGGNVTIYYTITASNGLNGSITPGSVTLASGSTQVFTITPNSGYQISNVLVDGVSVGAVATYTFNSIIANHTIFADFAAVSGGGGGGGGGTVVTLNIFNESTNNLLEIAALTNWNTNLPATSRVVFDTISHPQIGALPNYGYAFSTLEDPTLVTSHAVLLVNLQSNTTYYWRAVSHDSGSDVFGKEMSFTTSAIKLPVPIVDFNGTGAGVGGLVEPVENIVEQEVQSAETVNEESQTVIEQISSTSDEIAETQTAAAGMFFNLDKIYNYIKDHLCYLGWLLLLILIIYYLYKKYTVYKEKQKNKI